LRDYAVLLIRVILLTYYDGKGKADCEYIQNMVYFEHMTNIMSQINTQYKKPDFGGALSMYHGLWHDVVSVQL
jgi:hypothetical protein